MPMQKYGVGSIKKEACDKCHKLVAILTSHNGLKLCNDCLAKVQKEDGNVKS